MLKDDFSKKKIWDSYYIIPLIIWLFFTIIMTCALINELRIDGTLKESIFIKFLLVVGGLFLLYLFLSVKEIINYNYLIDNGIIIKGKMISAGTSYLMGTMMTASYVDDKTKKHYKCTTTTSFSIDAMKMQTFIENYPDEVRLMVDPKNYKKAAILVYDYCGRMISEHGTEKLSPKPFYQYITGKGRNDEKDSEK